MRPIRSLSFDAKTVVRGKFKPSTAAEKQFYKSLRRVAKVSGHIVDQFVEGATVKTPKIMQAALESYAKLIKPWAERQAAKLTAQVAKSNRRAYVESSKAIGTALKLNVAESNVGVIARALMNEQVALIQSIPIEAGLRAQNLALEAAYTGTRAAPDQSTIDEIKKQLGMSTEVATSRARLISRTETARANASINQARATAVGAKGYIWRATLDEATRKSHREMEGKYVEYAHPPTLSDGTTTHAGEIYNCRCYGEPVFED